MAALGLLPLHKYGVGDGPLPVDLPLSASGIQADWFTSVLRAQGLLSPAHKVASAVGCVTGEGKGFFSQLEVYDLLYQDETTGAKVDSPTAPSKVVVKMSGGNIKLKSPIEKKLLHDVLYVNETLFYTTADANLFPPRSFPSCYFAASRATTHVQVLEHLALAAGEPWSMTLERARSVVAWMARVHAAFWGKRTAPGAPSRVQNLFTGCNLGWYPPVFQIAVQGACKVAAKQYPDELGRLAGVLAALFGRSRAFLKHCRFETPLTLIHGDIKMDNLFFADRQVTAVDWANSAWSNPMVDFAYFLGRSIPAEERRAWEPELLQLYHDTLVSGGVRDYFREDCQRDCRLFRLSPLITVLMGIKGMAEDIDMKKGVYADTPSPADAPKRRWYDESLRRLTEYVMDGGVQGLLEESFERNSMFAPVIPCCCLWMQKDAGP